MDTVVLPAGSTLFHYSTTRKCNVVFENNNARVAKTNKGRASKGVFFLHPDMVQYSMMARSPYRFEFETIDDLVLVVIEEQHAFLDKYAHVSIESNVLGLGERVASTLSKIIENWSDNDLRKRHDVVDGYVCRDPVRYNMRTFEPEIYICRNSVSRKIGRQCTTRLMKNRRYPARGVAS